MRLSPASSGVPAALAAMTAGEARAWIWLDDADPPRGSRDVRRAGVAARRRRSHPAAGAGRRTDRGLGGHRLRRAGQPGRRRPDPAAGPVRRRGRAGSRAAADGPLGLCGARFRDGLGVARGAAAGDGFRPPRRRAGAGGARPGPARRGAGQGTRQCARPPLRCLDQEVVAASLGSTRRQRRHPDAMRVRLDRNGFPAAVDGGGGGHGFAPESASPPTRSSGCACCRRGCASTPGSARCTAAAATPPWSCARPTRRRCSAAARRPPARRWPGSTHRRAAPSAACRR